jgi:hypothetical protein
VKWKFHREDGTTTSGTLSFRDTETFVSGDFWAQHITPILRGGGAAAGGGAEALQLTGPRIQALIDAGFHDEPTDSLENKVVKSVAALAGEFRGRGKPSLDIESLRHFAVALHPLIHSHVAGERARAANEGRQASQAAAEQFVQRQTASMQGEFHSMVAAKAASDQAKLTLEVQAAGSQAQVNMLEERNKAMMAEGTALLQENAQLKAQLEGYRRFQQQWGFLQAANAGMGQPSVPELGWGGHALIGGPAQVAPSAGGWPALPAPE